MKLTLPLHDGWIFRRADQTEARAAIVPGCVHQDLLAHALIADPFYGENESALQWIGEAGWVYETEFSSSAEVLARRRVVLRCEGLDTFATVRLNGVPFGRADNMFRTWEWDVQPHLQPGANRLEITFDSVMPYIRERQAKHPMFSWNGAGGCAYNGTAYVRKMACNFGWDWGPKLVSAGIWKPISLVAWDAGRIDDVRITQHHTAGVVALDVSAEVAASDVISVRVAASLEGVSVAAAQGGAGEALRLAIPDPQLWWPNGLGAQPLYTVTVETLDSAGTVLDVATRRVGLRTLELQRRPDEWGESFQFAVNGVSFFAKGANWIPMDPFPSSARPARARQLLEAAAATHMNMIRVWGGGVYAGDDLLDACDELGLLVWHDFMFACTTYPTYDDAFLASIEAEARDAVRRIRHRACLALWCGNNELEQGLVADAWGPKTMSWADYDKLFNALLPRVVTELDGVTSYWPCSPH
ncbi:MAG: hypothetical protein H7Y06_11290, partial [Opitutaceae bacterium]|nr:hypothetical protein [Opitutaceae bacterium]